MDIRTKILTAIDETKKNLYERDELARLIWLTMGANLNLLMLGDPGTAKTMMALNLTKVIKESKIFHYTLNSFSVPDEIFGHFDLLELKNNNKLKRNTTNKLLDCHIAYLDEFFKCNSGTLNALLDVMNEKVYTDSYGTVKLPLKFLISSSNELPAEEDNLAAVLDRFQVKFLVKSIQDQSIRINAYLQSGFANEDIVPTINIQDIDEYREQVSKIKYTKEVAEMTDKIYQAIVKENIYVSDRTIFKTIPLVKAQAFLLGRDTVEPQDLIVLKDAFWNEISEQKTVRKIVFDLADPVWGKVEEVWEAIQSAIEEKSKEMKDSKDVTKTQAISFELVKKVRHAKEKIAEHVSTMKRMGSDYSDAEVKLKRLDEKAKEIFMDFESLK